MSNFFQWDPAKLGLQIPQMDEEHQVLISYMNKLHTLNEEAAPPQALARALDDLVVYTEKHFSDEEAFMERIAFPGLRTHKGVHKQLLEKLASFQQAFRSSRALPADLFIFFKMWLSAHICGIDTKYAQHSHAR